MIELVDEPAALVEACDRARADGLRVGLVPTMGALHAGHLALIDEARRQEAGFVVVTIFVNPLQFAAHEDLARYPRTLDSDLARASERGAHLAFVPEPSTMYPPGFQTHVSVDRLTTYLEGAHRPSHFRGVTTIVAKLFQLTGPCIAVFGRKDYQQWKVIERMTADLDMRVRVVGHPIVRESDGLALSSRNRYLDPGNRRRARGISQTLAAARRAFEVDGARDAASLAALARNRLETQVDRIDYVAVTDPDSLEAAEGQVTRALLAIAAHVGSTRLIDNTVLGEPDPALPSLDSTG